MGELFDAISEKERDMIKTYITNYATNDYQDLKAPLSYILRYWEKEKSFLFKKFGNKLILSKHYENEISNEQIKAKIQADLLAKGDEHPLVKAIRDITINRLLVKKDDLHCLFYDMFSTSALAKGSLGFGEAKRIESPEGKIITIPVGIKTMRCIKKVCDTFNISKELFEDFRIKHSMCLNQKTITGELCLSIHPLDYMTSSDNGYGWTSCMSWIRSGSYRQGTVEMMNSPYVVVAYLKGDRDNFYINNSPWSNKKWRQYFIVHKDIIIGIKSYPYEDSDLSKASIEWLRDILGVENYEEVEEEYFEDEDGFLRNHFSASTEYMYNDFEDNERLMFFALAKQHSQNIYINYSGETECMISGSPLWVDEEEAFSICVEPSELLILPEYYC